jgi:hypothetical protein
MPKVWIILFVAAAALTIFTIVDVLLTDARRARGVPKPVWVIIAILPIVGTLLWFLVGKGPADTTYRRATAPDDDPTFLSGLGTKAEQDERIRKLEQELADLDDDPPKE